MKRILWKTARITGITIGSILLVMFLLPIVFPGAIAQQIKTWTNKSITGELQFSAARLSFFRHFPSLTLTLHDFTLTGSEPFKTDTLLSGEALSFGIGLGSIFGKTIEINKFFIDDGIINVQVDENGLANYNIYKSAEDKDEVKTDSSETRLKIAGIFFNRCQLRYEDRSVPMLIEATDFYYEGRGGLDNAQFDLQSELRAETFDFVHKDVAYIQKRKLRAELVTGVNTASLALNFAKNQLLINELPVDFSGKMTIRSDGYDIDVNVVSGATDLANLFSALPPQYDRWFEETDFSGESEIRARLAGSYRAATGQAPDLSATLRINNGLIRHDKVDIPLSALYMNSTVQMPGLNPEKFAFNLDTLEFKVGDYTTRIKGMAQGMGAAHTYLRGQLSSELDLGQLAGAVGFSRSDMRGHMSLNGWVNGYYKTGQNPERIRPDTMILSIPAFDMQLDVRDGYFKHRSLPLAVENARTNIRSYCKTGQLADVSVMMKDVNADIGTGKIKGYLTLENFGTRSIDANLMANLNLEELTRTFPLKGYDFGGVLDLALKGKGSVGEDGKGIWPLLDGSRLQVKNAHVRTPWYPKAIEKIALAAQVKKTGAQEADIQVQPFTFNFEGQPFALQARLINPEDLRYDVQAKGTLDLGKIYQVFGVENYAVSGLMVADLDLKGSKADAVAGRYDRLDNRGTLRVQNGEVRSDAYPSPFFIPRTTLRFDREKLWLTDASLRYRNNLFALEGYAQNFIAYALEGGPLRGLLAIHTPGVVVDDFMVFAKSKARTASKARNVASSVPLSTPPPGSGVVLLPENVDLTLEADANEVVYGQTRLKDFKGRLVLQKGKLRLEETQAGVAGAMLNVAGSYAPASLRQATFDVTLKADSFDVKRAYEEIPMFREMASSAANVEGVVSVNYQLAGQLNDQMKPVYSSIKGKGVIVLNRVKVKGLKLFGAVSQATGKDSINNPNLKAVVMHSSIADNIITIECTRMKVFGFRPRVEGQTSLDGRLNLDFRLGLPPFGILCIPLSITGTVKEPIVKVRKARESDRLEGLQEHAMAEAEAAKAKAKKVKQ